MCGKYLKARQLAKEMEEKAKKTAEKKEKAQEMKEETEDLLELVKSSELELDLKEVEEEFDRAMEEFEEKNFNESLNIFNEVIEKIKSKTVSKRNDKLDPVSDILSELDENIANKDLQKKIDETKEMLDDGNIEEGIERTLEAIDESDDFLDEALKNRKEDLKSLIGFLDESSDVKEACNELISKVEYSLEADEYKRTLSLIEEIEDEILDEIKNKIDEEISNLERKKKKLEDQDLYKDDLNSFVENAKSKFKSENFSEALDLIQKGKSEINNLYDEKILGKQFKKLDEEIEEAEEINAPVKTVIEMRDEAEKLENKDKIEEAEELLDDALEKIEEAKFDKVLNTIAESREDFIKAKEIGADIKKPMEFLNTARDSLKENDYKEALEWARKGREKVQELTSKFENTKKRIQKQRENLREIEKTLDKKINKADSKLEELEKAWDDEELDKVISLSEELEEELEEGVTNEINDIIQHLQSLIDIGNKLDLDTEDFDKRINDSQDELERSQFVESAEILVDVRGSIENKIEEELERRFEQLRDDLEEVSDAEEDTREKAMDKVEEGLESLGEGELKDLFEKLQEAEKEINKMKIDSSAQKLEEASDILNHLEEKDIQIPDMEIFEEEIQEAEDLLENEEEKASRKIIDVYQTINDHLENKAKKIFDEAESNLKRASEEGIDTEEYEDKFESAKEKKSNNEYVLSIEKVKKLNDELIDMIEKRDEAYELISNGASKLRELDGEKDNQELRDAEALLKKAKKDFKSEDYDEGIEKAKQANQLLDEFEVEFLFSETKKKIEKKLNKVKDVGFSYDEIQEFKEEFEQIDLQTEDIDQSEMEEIVKEKEEELDEILIEQIKDELSRVEEIYDCANEIGFNLGGYKDKIKRTRSLIRQEELIESLNKLEELFDELDKVRGEGKSAREELAEAKIPLMKAEIMGSDVEEEKKLLNQSEDEFDEGDYVEAINKAKKVKKRSKEVQKEKLEDLIGMFQDRIGDLRSKGVDTALAENKIQRAIKAKNNGKHLDSIKFAMQSEGELEKMDMQKKIAKTSLEKAKKELEEIQNEGVVVEEPKKILEDADRSYQSGFYPKVIENSWNAWKKLNGLRKDFEKIRLFLSNIDGIIEEMDQRDYDFGEIKDIKNNIEEHYNNGEYQESHEYIEEFENIIKSKKGRIQEIVEEIEDDVKEKGEKHVEESVEKLKKAKSFLEFENTIEAARYLKEAKDLSGLRKLKEYDNLLEQVQNSIENAKRFGANVEDAVNKLENAERIRKEKDKIEAFEKIEEAYRAIEESLENYSPDIKVEVPETLTMEKWNRSEIILTNEGEALAKEVDIKLRGGKVKNLDHDGRIKAKDELKVTCDIKPVKEDAVIVASGLRIFDDEVFDDEYQLEITQGVQVKEINEPKICDICGEEVEAGEEMVFCDCGKKYDKSCSAETEKCPNCDTKLGVEKEEKVKEKKDKKKKRLSLDI